MLRPFKPFPVRARLAVSAVYLALLCPASLATQEVRYPATRASDQADIYHGVRVADPYRWLEDTESPETRAWIEAQNAVTHAHLAAVPQRDAIRARLTSLWNYPQFGVPRKEGSKYFSTENSGRQDHAVLYVQDRLTSPRRVLLDPNVLSFDGTISLADWAPSPNARLLAYSLSTGGSDWREIRVRDIATRRDLADTLQWIKFSGISWTTDNRGFFYSRFEPDTGNALTRVVRHHKLYYHRIGTSQSDDVLVFEALDQPDWILSGSVTEDGQYVIIDISEGTEVRNRIYFIDLGSPGRPVLDNPVVRLLDRMDAQYSFVGNIGPVFIFRTDDDAPRQRVIGIDINIPRREAWLPLVPQGSDAIENVTLAGGRLILTTLHDARSSVLIYEPTRILGQRGRQAPPATRGDQLDPRFGRGLLSPSFALAREIQLPGPGTVSLVRGKADEPEIFYDFVSYLQPRSIYRYDLRGDSSEAFRIPQLTFDPSLYETRQVFYTSRDGTRIPMFITMRKGGVPLDGSTPTILHGYGGFNLAQKPSFAASNIVWLEMGGIYAVANIRGGSEYGREWHEAGRLANKQNVFDDYIAAAEYLVRERYTSPAKLVASGRSNGGLLVGAVLNQRPDLFGAAVPTVGVMDMLRFHKFTIGWAWTSDYGSPDDPEQFRILHAYSPLHNIKTNTSYPATLILTADHDDRVVPGHSFKYAATLQAAQTGPAPILIRVETRVGHGGGTALSRLIEEWTDRLAFLVRALGTQPVLAR